MKMPSLGIHSISNDVFAHEYVNKAVQLSDAGDSFVFWPNPVERLCLFANPFSFRWIMIHTKICDTNKGAFILLMRIDVQLGIECEALILLIYDSCFDRLV